MHLLAVSGLHLGIFLAGVWFALRRLGLRPAVTYPLVGVAVAAVLWIVGPRVSLMRAALLFAFLGLGSVLADLGLVLRRWVNPHQALAGAGLVLLAIRPAALWDVGFQLSMAATAAILVVFDPAFGVQVWINRHTAQLPGPIHPSRYALGLLAVSAAAQAGTLPFLVYHFAAVYPFVLLANLSAVPLAAIALWAGLLALAFSATPLGPLLSAGLGLVLQGLTALVEGLASIPGSMLIVPREMSVWLGACIGYLFLAAVYSPDASSWISYGTSIVSGSEGRGGRSWPRVKT
jgi:competence protein ComEC